MAAYLRPCLLWHRNDACVDAEVRPGPAGLLLPRLAPTGRRDDRGRDRDQQDGAGGAAVLRPDAGAAVGNQHGQLRQRRGLLPLQLLGGPRRGPIDPGRHLRAGVSTDRRGAHVRPESAAEEDTADQGNKDVVSEVTVV
jgi:hypothetical protein